MKISDILATKGSQVCTIGPSETISELSRRLAEKRMGVMVVSSDGETLNGIISERDIAYGLHKRRGDLHLHKVSNLMTKDVITCTPETLVDEALEVMTQNHIRHIVVVDECAKLVGLVSIRDAIETRFQRIQNRTTSLKSATAIQ